MDSRGSNEGIMTSSRKLVTIDICDHRGGLIRHEIKSSLWNNFIQNTNNTFTVTKIRTTIPVTIMFENIQLEWKKCHKYMYIKSVIQSI